MGKLEFNRYTKQWEGSIETDEEFFRVYISDETFRTHYDAYLENLGIPTQTYLEMIAYVDKVGRQHYEAMQEFTADVERWRTCDDSGVRILVQKYSNTRVSEDDGRPRDNWHTPTREDDGRPQGNWSTPTREDDGRPQGNWSTPTREGDGRPQGNWSTPTREDDGRPQGAHHPSAPPPSLL